MWLRDFLPDAFEDSRILLYGYDFHIKDSTSTDSIGDYAKRFLIHLQAARKNVEIEIQL
jgi:hypothetical protein